MADETGNIIELRENGPVSFRGNIEVRNSEGAILLSKQKVSLCRCGGSLGKPACDGAHKTNGFQDGASVDGSHLPAAEAGKAGKLLLTTKANGPLLVQGTYTIVSSGGERHTSGKTIALCRCGGSARKPFCDGAHKNNGFEAP